MGCSHSSDLGLLSASRLLSSHRRLIVVRSNDLGPLGVSHRRLPAVHPNDLGLLGVSHRRLLSSLRRLLAANPCDLGQPGA